MSPSSGSGQALLEVRDLNVSYGGIRALRDISLRVEEDEIVALLGSNGAGKTTTLSAISGLAPYAGIVRLPTVPDGCRPNWTVVAVQVDPEQRDWVVSALKAEGVSAAFHYVPLHSSPFARQSPDIAAVDLPVTDRAAASLVRLPISAAFTDADCEDVVTACVRVFEAMAVRA